MAIFNVISLDTQGVDMKSNPLRLGNRKLHAATNIAFEEGVLKTRPGFEYYSLGITGQFQGACEFSPSLGLSYRSFVGAQSALAIAVAGEIYLTDTTKGEVACAPLQLSTGAPYACSGDVNLYQAENFLIVQNRNANTHWWAGIGQLVESPGMSEDLFWEDPCPPTVSYQPRTLTAQDAPCDSFPCESQTPTCGITLHTRAIEHYNPTSGNFQLTNTGDIVVRVTGISNTADPDMEVFPLRPFPVEPGETRLVSFSSLLDLQTTYIQVFTNCEQLSVFIPEEDVAPGACGILLTNLKTLVANPTSGGFDLVNTGGLPVDITSISNSIDPFTGYFPTVPFTIAVGQTIHVNFSSLVDVRFAQLSILSDCENTPEIVIEVPPVSGGGGGGEDPDDCEMSMHSAAVVAPAYTTATVMITNSGTAAGTVETLVCPALIGTPSPSAPFDVEPGETIEVTLSSEGDMRLVTITATSSCGETEPLQVTTPEE